MINVLSFEKVVHLRISDEDMKIFEALENQLNKKKNVKLIYKTMTFETPDIEYEYKGISFSLLFDEQDGETFVAVVKPYNYHVIQDLIQSLYEGIKT